MVTCHFHMVDDSAQDATAIRTLLGGVNVLGNPQSALQIHLLSGAGATPDLVLTRHNGTTESVYLSDGGGNRINFDFGINYYLYLKNYDVPTKFEIDVLNIDTGVNISKWCSKLYWWFN